MMQADRDQQTVKEGVDARADRAQLLDMFAKAHQSVKDQRPDVHQNECHRDHQE